MNIDFKAFFGALVILSVLGGAVGVTINMISPAHAFYGSMAKDGLPPWECYDHPDHCK